MKKLLFIMVAIMSLCACGSNDEDVSTANLINQMSYDGRAYDIDSVRIYKDEQGVCIGVSVYSNMYRLEIDNCELKAGHNNLLNSSGLHVTLYKKVESRRYLATHIWGYDWDGTHFTTDDGYDVYGSSIGEELSYIEFQEQNQQAHIEAYITDSKNSKIHTVKAVYSGKPIYKYI